MEYTDSKEACQARMKYTASPYEGPVMAKHRIKMGNHRDLGKKSQNRIFGR